ncbi:hypothetical protein, partial [uncultured Selenomonas sp.]|uniref:hypothetical protein n=1 Tax=uncultured Selenomonas sp. TaxID=159275 RepID=UPI002582A119
TLASGAESGSSTLPERTSKTRISIVRENLRCLIVSIIEGTRFCNIIGFLFYERNHLPFTAGFASPPRRFSYSLLHRREEI